MKQIGILAHPKRVNTNAVADRIAASLQQAGVDVWLYHDWTTDDVTADVQTADMVIAIGGDGAMLRAARVCAPYQVPVLGVNMGRLGFLTEIANPEQWDTIIPQILGDEYWIEKRMMITASIIQGETVRVSGDALNEIVVSGTGFGNMVRLDTYIDRDWTTTYNVDALIVATPTGSTAYALALGGPILPPDLTNILVIPAAPHLSMDRPIVLSEGSVVDVMPTVRNRNQVMVQVDGVKLADLQPDETISVQASKYQSLFVRMRGRNYFYRSLLDKLEPRVNRSAPEQE